MKAFPPYLNVLEEYRGVYICYVPSERHREVIPVNHCSILSRDPSALTALFP